MNLENGNQAAPAAWTGLATMAARLAAAIGFQPTIERRRRHRRAKAAERAMLANNQAERRAQADRRNENGP
jgi:hypothetical protein